MNMRPMPTFLAALLALHVLFVPAALAGEHAPYPVWWSPEFSFVTLDQFDEPFEKEFGSEGDGRMLVYKGEGPNKEEAYAYDCRSLLKLDFEGYFPKTTSQVEKFLKYDKQCDVMEILRETKPSQVSNVNDFIFDNTSIDFLPAMVNRSGSCDFACRQYRANEKAISWRDFEISEFLSIQIIHKYRMVVTTDNSLADLEILARADFNNDGTEDMLVQYIGGATHGTWGTILKFILSRDEPDAVLRVLNAEQYNCSIETYGSCDLYYDYPDILKSVD